MRLFHGRCLKNRHEKGARESVFKGKNWVCTVCESIILFTQWLSKYYEWDKNDKVDGLNWLLCALDDCCVSVHRLCADQCIRR